ncbi:MlaC/ttg2D family ABC transporter substrate-binding protein [Hirschia litorea]|uniref:Phospholipid-binding protein MlaC n=1 Tax=Hirschia litorea TaxID=1199156 RepID=A0ABW2IJS1_9PROT
MKKLILSSVLLLSAPLAVAESQQATMLKASAAAGAASANVDRSDASQVVTEAGQSAIKYLSDGALSESEAQDLLGFLDVERVAKFTLGRYGRTLDEADITRFTAAFEKYASHQFQTHLADFKGADLKVIETINRKPDDAVVKTEIKTATGEIQAVNWRLMKNDSQWNVVDVEALGFWFAIEQRAQFTAVLDKTGGDVDALIAKISAKK